MLLYFVIEKQMNQVVQLSLLMGSVMSDSVTLWTVAHQAPALLTSLTHSFTYSVHSEEDRSHGPESGAKHAEMKMHPVCHQLRNV